MATIEIVARIRQPFGGAVRTLPSRNHVIVEKTMSSLTRGGDTTHRATGDGFGENMTFYSETGFGLFLVCSD